MHVYQKTYKIIAITAFYESIEFLLRFVLRKFA
jgi:hypothetical protein